MGARTKTVVSCLNAVLRASRFQWPSTVFMRCPMHAGLNLSATSVQAGLSALSRLKLKPSLLCSVHAGLDAGDLRGPQMS
jgi:hypothetical protein